MSRLRTGIIGESSRAFEILTCIPIQKRSQGRFRSRWEDNVRKKLVATREIGLSRLRTGIIGEPFRSFKILTCIPLEKRSQVRSKSRWDDDIRKKREELD